MKKGEDNLIAWIADRVGRSRSTPQSADTTPGDIVGIGDDMAILRTGDATILAAADMLLDGVHFNSRRHTPRQIGRKALAVNLSDCAAMAVRPWCALVSVSLPADWPMALAQALFEGIAELAEAFDCQIVGGDTNSWNRPLTIDVTILATPWDGLRPIERRGAKPGDAIFVTGRLGGSLAQHHMDFTPRVRAARRLATLLGDDLHAMMDLSDGISTDAPRLAKASGVGMVFERKQLLTVGSDSARMSAANDDALLASVVGDGEDFELMFVVDAARPGNVPEVLKAESTGSDEVDSLALTRVGTIVAEPGVWILAADGKRQALAPTGWQHFQ